MKPSYKEEVLLVPTVRKLVSKIRVSWLPGGGKRISLWFPMVISSDSILTCGTGLILSVQSNQFVQSKMQFVQSKMRNCAVKTHKVEDIIEYYRL